MFNANTAEKMISYAHPGCATDTHCKRFSHLNQTLSIVKHFVSYTDPLLSVTCTGMPSRSTTASNLALKTSGLRRPRLMPSWLVKITTCQGGERENRGVSWGTKGEKGRLREEGKQSIPCTPHSEAASACGGLQGTGFCKGQRDLGQFSCAIIPHPQ